MTPEWDLLPGTQIERKTLQERFGGRTQGGIGPSRQSPNVFVFSDPAAGEPHGYVDGWRADGAFHYTGEGQRGDQQMKSGNASILNHAEEGRALRVFMGARGTVTYEDEFELDSDEPWYTTDAPETGGGPLRSVIVFRMRPKTIDPKPARSKLDELADAEVEQVAVEEQWTEKAFVDPSREPYEAERREQKLVLAYRAHLERAGHLVGRLKIKPRGEAKPLFSDLFDETDNVVIEAKGTTNRAAVRMAIGQLADYGRFVSPTPIVRILLPASPRADLLDLCRSQQIGVVIPTATGFRTIDPT
jgi:hypothetical protein